MFKKFLQNREVRIRVAEISQNDTAPVVMDEIPIDPEKIAKISKEVIRDAAIAVGSVIVLSILASTLGEIAVEKTKQKNNPYLED